MHGWLKMKKKKCRCDCSYAFSNTPHSPAASARLPYLKRWRCISEAACEWTAEDKEKKCRYGCSHAFSNASHAPAASARLPYLSAFSFQLSAFRFPLSAFSFQLSAFSPQPSALSPQPSALSLPLQPGILVDKSRMLPRTDRVKMQGSDPPVVIAQIDLDRSFHREPGDFLIRTRCGSRSSSRRSP